MINRSISVSHVGHSRGKQIAAQQCLKAGFLLLFMALAGSVHAAGAGGGGLPWEAPLTTLSNSVTGPVAYAVSLIGIVGAGGILIFAGGQVNEFLRAVLFCVLVIAFIIAAKNTLTAFGFAAGSTVAQEEEVTHGFAESYTSSSWD